MLNGKNLKKIYSDLNANQQFELASALEMENIFYVNNKKISQVIPLSRFETITIQADNPNLQDNDQMYQHFSSVYDEHFLPQCDALPDTQFQKLKYLFNVVRVGLGEAIVEDRETFEDEYKEMNPLEKRKFSQTLLKEKLIEFKNS